MQKNSDQQTDANKSQYKSDKGKEIHVNRQYNNEFDLADKLYILFLRQMTEDSAN